MTQLLGQLLTVTALLPAQAPMARSAGEIRAALAQEMNFPGFEDEKTTLDQALTFLTVRSGVRIRVDRAAFRAAGLAEVLRTPIGAIPANHDTTFGMALCELLTHVEVPAWPFDPATGRYWQPGNPLELDALLFASPEDPSGACFVIREDRIEVTTAYALLLRKQTLDLPPRFTPAQEERRNVIRRRLAEEVDFPGMDDPKLTLQEVLMQFSDRYGLKVRINEEAFTKFKDDLKDVAKFPILETMPLPGRKNDPLDWVLRDILNRLPNTSGTVYFVWPDGIEVTTPVALSTLLLRPQAPPPPTTNQLKRTREYRDRLLRSVRFPGFRDPKMTLGESLEFLAKSYDLHFEVNEKAFRCGPDDLKDIERFQIVETRPIPAARDIVPGKILELVLARVPNSTGAVFVLRPTGYIEITTRFAVAAEMRGQTMEEALLIWMLSENQNPLATPCH